MSEADCTSRSKLLRSETTRGVSEVGCSDVNLMWRMGWNFVILFTAVRIMYRAPRCNACFTDCANRHVEYPQLKGEPTEMHRYQHFDDEMRLHLLGMDAGQYASLEADWQQLYDSQLARVLGYFRCRVSDAVTAEDLTAE